MGRNKRSIGNVKFIARNVVLMSREIKKLTAKLTKLTKLTKLAVLK